MLLDDALEVGMGLRAVPGALRVDEHDRPARADAQAIDLAAQHPAVDVGELERGQALLEVIPRGERLFLRGAAPADAQEDVPARGAEVDFRAGAGDDRGDVRLGQWRTHRAWSSVSPVRMRCTRSMSL